MWFARVPPPRLPLPSASTDKKRETCHSVAGLRASCTCTIVNATPCATSTIRFRQYSLIARFAMDAQRGEEIGVSANSVPAKTMFRLVEAMEAVPFRPSLAPEPLPLPFREPGTPLERTSVRAATGKTESFAFHFLSS